MSALKYILIKLFSNNNFQKAAVTNRLALSWYQNKEAYTTFLRYRPSWREDYTIQFSKPIKPKNPGTRWTKAHETTAGLSSNFLQSKLSLIEADLYETHVNYRSTSAGGRPENNCSNKRHRSWSYFKQTRASGNFFHIILKPCFLSVFHGRFCIRRKARSPICFVHGGFKGWWGGFCLESNTVCKKGEV